MPIKIQEWYTREEIMNSPEALYIFGDNLRRTGYGGQAGAARDCPNAIGIPTLVSPGNPASPRSFWVLKFAAFRAFLKIDRALRKGQTVVWPKDGVGTGIANLQHNCPQLLKYIQREMCLLITKYGETPYGPQRKNETAP